MVLLSQNKFIKKLDFEKISKDFFLRKIYFLGYHLLKKIYELPIKTLYNSKSNLNPIKTIIPFIFKHAKNFLIRLKYDFL